MSKGSWTIGEDEKIIVFGGHFFLNKTIFPYANNVLSVLFFTGCFNWSCVETCYLCRTGRSLAAMIWIVRNCSRHKWNAHFAADSTMRKMCSFGHVSWCAANEGAYLRLLDQTSEWSKWSLWDITFRLQESLSHYIVVVMPGCKKNGLTDSPPGISKFMPTRDSLVSVMGMNQGQDDIYQRAFGRPSQHRLFTYCCRLEKKYVVRPVSPWEWRIQLDSTQQTRQELNIIDESLNPFINHLNIFEPYK